MDILNFRSWDRNKQLDEAYNIPIPSSKEIPDEVEDAQDSNEIEKLIDYLQSIEQSDLPLVSNEKGQIKIRRNYEPYAEQINQWIKENDLNINFASSRFGNGSVGESGVKINENTQEIMVCALLLLNRKFDDNINVSTALNIIDEAKTQFDDVVGAKQRPELLDQFDSNFDDLATAISSANAIRDIIGDTKKVFWTGKGWAKEIQKYNPPIGGVQDYNSSDIVVKGTNGKYYGFSLKKKASRNETDPTLINKPITGDKSFLASVLTTQEMKKIEESKEAFFDNVIYRYSGKKPDQLREKEKNRIIRSIPKKKMSEFLRDKRNVFFRRVDQIIMKNPDTFMKEFLRLIFRTKLKDIEDTGEFEFYLLTGIGRKVGENVVADAADVEDIPHTMEVLTDIFNSNLTMERTPGKLHAWEVDSSTGKKSKAAKLFYTIFSNDRRIVDIEIRYKGSYTANPQFQAVATPSFKNMFGE